MRLALSASGCAEQALSASAAPAAARPANPARRPGLESTGPIRAALYLRPRAAAPPAVPAPPRRPRRPRPPTRSARAPWPRAPPAWRPARRPAPAAMRRTRAAIARTAPSSIGNDSQLARLRRHGRGEHRADLRRAGVPGRDRQHAARRRLGGHHPVGLGEGAREDERLAGGQERRELVVLQAPGEDDALAQVAGRGPVVVAGGLEEGQQMAQRRSRAALELAPGLRDGADGVAVAVGQRVEQRQQAVAEAAEADDHQPRLGHERPRRQQQVDPLGDDELADEADVAVAGEVEPAQGARRRRRRRARRRPRRRRPRWPPGARSGPRPPAAGVVARAELVDVDARAVPGACARAGPSSCIAAHSDSPVWREPTRTVRAPAPGPPAPRAGSAPGRA